MADSPMCERCGGPTYYAGNVTAPSQTIYGCDKCKRMTWVKAAGSSAQQQQQPQPPKSEPENNTE
jgi:hypothetical protein